MAVHSQGRQPLGEERTDCLNAEGVAVMLLNPEGMAVHSQGRQPLGEEQTDSLNAEGVAVRLPPFQG